MEMLSDVSSILTVSTRNSGIVLLQGMIPFALSENFDFKEFDYVKVYGSGIFY